MTDVEPSDTKKFKRDNSFDTPPTPSNDETRASNSVLLKEANDALQESNRIHVRPIVDETRLGIELFIGDQKDQFHGLIKSRYADFIVHEIDLDGNVAQLTNLEPPEEQEPTSSMSIQDFVDDKAFESLSDVNNGYLNQYKIDVTGMDKDTRTSLHHAIRAAFDRLESTTTSNESDKPKEEQNGGTASEQEQDSKPDSTQQVDNDQTNQPEQETAKAPDERKYIVITRRNKVSRPKNIWPRDRPDFTHFILYKENKDTMDAIHCLAGAVNAKSSSFGSAGVKDRRAVTSQWISAWRLEPKRLLNATKRFNKRPYIRVGNFCFKKEPIRLGRLKANKFDIVIRHLVHNSEGLQVVENSVESIKEKGFINYFGLQRFGTRSIRTYEIGLAILQSNWKKAIDLVLSYRYVDDSKSHCNAVQDKKTGEKIGGDDDVSTSPSTDGTKTDRPKQEHKHWNNGAHDHNLFIDLWKSKRDAEAVFKKYPQFRFSNEGHIMKSLSKSHESSGDFLGALTSLPRTVRSMYVHSYQSLLWNRLVTYRLKNHGYKVIPGDLILSSDANISDNSLDILLSADEVEVVGNDVKECVQETAASNGNKSRKTPIEELNSKLIVATADNLDKFNIFDVVLPLVGSKVKLPQNDVGAECERLLKEDDLTIESFRTHEKLFISYGSYRKMLVRPNNVQWSIVQYSDPQQNIIETDLDLLQRDTMSRDVDGSNRKRSPPRSDSSDEALIVSFELPPSSYATMCLRELMKTRHDLNNIF